ncbi:hypothetical protein B4U80_03586 [Leptotrombidium deliense]|uniref:Methyltransferase type 11 domain-containing protein n=1 Tax=Leptotrombidium deliense TaxID=299467 RepID=A0A443SDF5_9ACAR|nr:hypothetical protein B4U80_03586 [Leptotrombidium deliense]
MIAVAKLYNDTNDFQRKGGAKIFSMIQHDFGPSAKFGTVVDIGCGTGNVTLDFLNSSQCDQLIAFDKNKSMIEFAREINKSDEVNYEVADISDNFDELKYNIKLSKKADLVFSVYCLHWVQNKTKAFENINRFLKPGGKCYLLFMYWSDLYMCDNEFILSSKWKKYIPNIDEMLSTSAPFHKASLPNIADSTKKLKESMEIAGFTKCEVTIKQEKYFFEEFNHFMLDFHSVCPYVNFVPASERNEFFKDYFDFLRKNYNTGSKNVDDICEFRPHFLEYSK